MIKLSNEILSRVASKHPQINIKDLKAYPNEMYNNGVSGRVNLLTGAMRANEVYIDTLYFDIDGNEITETKYGGQWDYEWNKDSEPKLDTKLHHPVIDFLYEYGDWKESKYPMKTLQDEMVVLNCLANQYATDEQHLLITQFRYDTQNLLDRFPKLVDIEELIPEVYNELKEDAQYDKWDRVAIPNFLKCVKYVKDALPPENCPSYVKRINYTKPMYQLCMELIPKYVKNKNWTDGDRLNLYRFMSLKYSFKGQYKHYKQIENNYSTMKTRKDIKI